MWAFELITEQSTAIIVKNARWNRENTNSKMIDIANCKTCKNRSLDIDEVISVRYYHQTAKVKALYESTDGSAGEPTDNPPKSDWLGDVHLTVHELTVRVY